jgi:SAM-dependent methyltransferase
MKLFILLNLLLVIILTLAFFFLFSLRVNPGILILYTVLFLIYLILILSSIWPSDSPWAPGWRTNRTTAEAICRLAKVNGKSIVYDLGSGDGEALIAAAKLGARGVGIEIDPLRFWVTKIRAKTNGVSDRLNFIRGDFFKQDISEANIIFVYLIPKTLDRLLPKFKKELKKGTKIISYRYEMNLTPKKVDKNNELFLYIV